MKSYCILSILFCSFVASGYATHPRAIARLGNWTEREYTSLGLRVSLPIQSTGSPVHREIVCDSEEYFSNTDSHALVILLHPEWFGVPMGEPMYHMSLHVAVLSPTAFQDFQQGRHWYNRIGGFQEIPVPLSEDTLQFTSPTSRGQSLFLFQHKVLGTQKHVLGLVEIMDVKRTLANREADRAAAERMLDSIKDVY